MEQQRKLAVLARIAAELRQADVTWALGASGLLYFRGLAPDFHDLDLMAGMVIVKDGAAHDGSLRQEDIAGTVTVCGEPVPLHSLACWRRYYALMGRAEKAKLLGSLPENH